MKKHDEGYVMILVLVVMIVMGLVTASILTFSLRNLQNQQLSIERMADKYAAQGLIEEKIARLLSGEAKLAVSDDVIVDDTNNPQTITFSLEEKVGSATVNCEILLECASIEKSGSQYILNVINPEPQYITYKITYSTGETEEGGGGE